MSFTTPAIQSLTVRQDLAVVRSLLAKVNRSHALAPLNLFGRRIPERMLDYGENRIADRSPVELPIFVTPAAFDGTYARFPEGEEDAILCFTKDVSLRGVGFTHEDPLDASWVVVSFDLLDAYITLFLEVRWKNVEIDRYLSMSGGRFVGVIDEQER